MASMWVCPVLLLLPAAMGMGGSPLMTVAVRAPPALMKEKPSVGTLKSELLEEIKEYEDAVAAYAAKQIMEETSRARVQSQAGSGLNALNFLVGAGSAIAGARAIAVSNRLRRERQELQEANERTLTQNLNPLSSRRAFLSSLATGAFGVGLGTVATRGTTDEGRATSPTKDQVQLTAQLTARDAEIATLKTRLSEVGVNPVAEKGVAGPIIGALALAGVTGVAAVGQAVAFVRADDKAAELEGSPLDAAREAIAGALGLTQGTVVKSWYDSGVRLEAVAEPPSANAATSADAVVATSHASGLSVQADTALQSDSDAAAPRAADVQSWYDTGLRLDAAPVPAAVAQKPAPTSSSEVLAAFMEGRPAQTSEVEEQPAAVAKLDVPSSSLETRPPPMPYKTAPLSSTAERPPPLMYTTVDAPWASVERTEIRRRLAQLLYQHGFQLQLRTAA